MKNGVSIVLFFTMLLFVSESFSQKSVAVLNIKSEQLKPGDCIAVTNFMTTELQKMPGYKILAWDDVTKMLEHQAGKQAIGCDDDKCMVEIGGALGVEYIIAGDIGQLGSRYVMNMRIIDIVKAETVKRVSRSASQDIGLFIDQIPAIVNELLGTSEKVISAVPSGNDGMVWIGGGTFNMGSDEGERDEKPVHTVTLSGFYMDKTEVTQSRYERVKGNNPSQFKNCPTCPVEFVSWTDAKDYCEKIGKRLPTEAEWEYAARAGSMTKFYAGDSVGSTDLYAWYNNNSDGKTHPVGQKRPNAWGLYDMNGNVWEWCSDWYNDGYNKNSPSRDPQGPASGIYRVVRGGAFDLAGTGLRSTLRYKFEPGYRFNSFGFRCVRQK